MATEREPEEGNRTRQVGQDHHPLAVEPVAQNPAEGPKASATPWVSSNVRPSQAADPPKRTKTASNSAV
jgi:hypothetical protein